MIAGRESFKIDRATVLFERVSMVLNKLDRIHTLPEHILPDSGRATARDRLGLQSEVTEHDQRESLGETTGV